MDQPVWRASNFPSKYGITKQKTSKKQKNKILKYPQIHKGQRCRIYQWLKWKIYTKVILMFFFCFDKHLCIQCNKKIFYMLSLILINSIRFFLAFFLDRFKYFIYRPVNLPNLKWEVTQKKYPETERNKAKQGHFTGINPISHLDGDQICQRRFQFSINFKLLIIWSGAFTT